MEKNKINGGAHQGTVGITIFADKIGIKEGHGRQKKKLVVEAGVEPLSYRTKESVLLATGWGGLF